MKECPIEIALCWLSEGGQVDRQRQAENSFIELIVISMVNFVQ